MENFQPPLDMWYEPDGPVLVGLDQADYGSST